MQKRISGNYPAAGEHKTRVPHVLPLGRGLPPLVISPWENRIKRIFGDFITPKFKAKEIEWPG